MVIDKEKPSILPSKIEKKCILRSTLEIKFESCLVSLEAVPGMLYEKIQDKYNAPVQRPTFNFNGNKHLFSIERKDGLYTIGLSETSITLNTSPFGYEGWTAFRSEFDLIYNHIKNLFGAPKEADIRYINAFEEINIFDALKINVQFAQNSITDNYLNVSLAKLNHDETLGALIKILNNTRFSCNGKPCAGSVIDITVSMYSDNPVIEKLMQLIDDEHKYSKEVFFSLFTEDAIQKFLKPVKEENV